MSRAIRIHARSEIAHRPVSRSRQDGAVGLGSTDNDTALLPHAHGKNPRVVLPIRMNAQRHEHSLHHRFGGIDRGTPNLGYTCIGQALGDQTQHLTVCSADDHLIVRSLPRLTDHFVGNRRLDRSKEIVRRRHH